jgi:hypothetical protein
MFIADLTLLLIMLVGLFRLRRHIGGTVGLVEYLWRQVWFPPVVVHETR